MDDEDGFVEDDEQFSGETISNKNPEVVTESFGLVTRTLERYGWIILFGIIVLWYLKGVIERRLERWSRQREDAIAHRTDSAEAMVRHERMLEARRKLQDEYDSLSAMHEAEVKQREDEKRKQKLNDWESHRRGGTSKESRDRAQALGGGGGLMGNGPSGRWTPSRRQGRT